MVIVITVLGLLMAFLIPKITEAQAKARDIKRQSDITMIAAALVSYKHDHGEFPKANEWWMCVSELSDDLDWYLTTIPQDPSMKGIEELYKHEDIYWNTQNKPICNIWYSYIADMSNFILVYAVDEDKNWNYNCYIKDNDTCCYLDSEFKNRQCWISTSKSNRLSVIYDNNSNELNLNWANWFKTLWLNPWNIWNYFVYIYK